MKETTETKIPSPIKSSMSPKYKDADVLAELRKALPTATRTGRGGQIFEYIPTKFVSDRLTEIWGIDWDFQIIDTIIEKGHVAVQVRLHYPTEYGRGFKDAFGGAKYEDAIGLGDCLKKSASLALKKAASLIGIDLRDEEALPISEEQKSQILVEMTRLNMILNQEMLDKLQSMTAIDAANVLESLKNS